MHASVDDPSRERVLSWTDVLESEYAALHGGQEPPTGATSEETRLGSILARIRAARHAALCLSGGGIRSASFAMGVVQGLARRGLLSRFHYLSTVSGGGYTGGWLSAWMARSGAAHVHEQLEGSRAGKGGVEPDPLRHVRSYSAYLTPRLGLLSADTWTLIATMARNVLLIWLVALPLIAGALMVPRLLVAWPMTTLSNWRSLRINPDPLIAFLMIVGTLLAISAIAFVLRNLYTYSGRDVEVEKRPDVTVQQFMTRCLIPLVIAMAMLSQGWEMQWSKLRLDPTVTEPMKIAMIGGIGFWLFVYFAAWLINGRGRNYSFRSAFLSAFAGALAGTIGAFASATLFGLTQWNHPPEFFATLAVPLSLWGLLVSTQIVVGLASRRMTDAEREANARFSGWLLIVIVSWIAICGLSLYGPVLLNKLGTALRLKALGALAGVGGVAGLLTSFLGAASRTSVPDSASNANGGGNKFVQGLQRVALALAAPVFVASVVVLVSSLDIRILEAGCAARPDWCPPDDASGVSDLFKGRTAGMATADHASPLLVMLMMAGLLLTGYLLSRLIDTNRFSLHAMYRVRLVRTFLGASKPEGQRHPDRFTGFDETDDLAMKELWPARGTRTDAVPPPLHVVNLTLNMVAGTDLATQNRKATSFTVTPLHAGSSGVGYRPTSQTADEKPERLYGGSRGITLGTAIAISGAAASPNAGYHSSPAVTFLMTLFNARLGWWLGNPGRAGRRTFSDDEPRLALLPILQEMFGRTTDHSPYVYLSDGGHFENLGLYEMVRRRCRFIVVSDAGCDPKAAFDDLGGAIRKIRIDFGVPIEFESGIPISSRTSPNHPADGPYWAVGRIMYSRVDGGGAEADGILLYIKPAFYGKEPCDVFNYGTSCQEFPHETTANQFFGETQFESYRMLGAHAVDQMCESEFNVPADSDQVIGRAEFDQWFQSRVAKPVVAPATRAVGMDAPSRTLA